MLLTENMDEAVEFANLLAPEHLEVCCDNPFAYLGRLDNAGSLFLGHYSPEPLGDYFAGPNHVLPTGGTARFFSPLSVDDFVKKSGFVYYPKEALLDAADDIILFFCIFYFCRILKFKLCRILKLGKIKLFIISGIFNFLTVFCTNSVDIYI